MTAPSFRGNRTFRRARPNFLGHKQPVPAIINFKAGTGLRPAFHSAPVSLVLRPATCPIRKERRIQFKTESRNMNAPACASEFRSATLERHGKDDCRVGDKPSKSL